MSHNIKFLVMLKIKFLNNLKKRIQFLILIKNHHIIYIQYLFPFSFLNFLFFSPSFLFSFSLYFLVHSLVDSGKLLTNPSSERFNLSKNLSFPIESGTDPSNPFAERSNTFSHFISPIQSIIFQENKFDSKFK